MNNLSEEQMKMLEPYMRNNMQHLKKMTSSILSKTGEEIYDLDYDDFYSIANETAWKTIMTYNSARKCKYDTYLYASINFNVKTEIRNRHRQKRWINYIAIHYYCTDDEFDTLYNIDSEIDLFEEIEKDYKYIDLYNEIKKYYPHVTKEEFIVLFYKANGYKDKDIKNFLEITSYRYGKIKENIKNIKVI